MPKEKKPKQWVSGDNKKERKCCDRSPRETDAMQGILKDFRLDHRELRHSSTIDQTIIHYETAHEPPSHTEITLLAERDIKKNSQPRVKNGCWLLEATASEIDFFFFFFRIYFSGLTVVFSEWRSKDPPDFWSSRRRARTWTAPPSSRLLAFGSPL